MIKADLSCVGQAIIIKVIIQNDVFDVFTDTNICYRFDLATAELLREISFDVEELGEKIVDIQYFERVDQYVILTTKNFAIGDFVYGFRVIEAVTKVVDIRKNLLAYGSDDGITVLDYPQLSFKKQIKVQELRAFCFVDEDTDIFITTDRKNYRLSCATLELETLTNLNYPYKELRYKNDYIIGIKEHGIDFIEEDILEVSSDYPCLHQLDRTLTAVKLCDDEIFIIVGGSKGGVEIFNTHTNEEFFKGIIVPECSIEAIHMDMEYQAVLIYTKEQGVEIYPFVDFI